jgi:hypothetical protein
MIVGEDSLNFNYVANVDNVRKCHTFVNESEINIRTVSVSIF